MNLQSNIILTILLISILLLFLCSNSKDFFQNYWNYPTPKMLVRSGYDSGTREYTNPLFAIQVAQGLDTN